MYTITFYSFKGGVGRTLALANAGVELARTGRRVLLVDFDLEAPGLDTIARLRPKEPQRGLVEYVSIFIATRSAPEVRDFVYEVPKLRSNGGRLWVMPAGKRDREYSRKLNSINWQTLYKELEGYMLFEDLKAQWKASVGVDYALIDSRTGHTDTEGICTRQLPDALVILFFPSDQNLVGLKRVVSTVRAQDEVWRGKQKKLYFVMSNVPDLDDEEEILPNIERKFQEELGYHSLTSTIHRYDSLSLLNQALFVIERPKSRLAKEYRRLLERIVEYNIEDRQAVIRRLRDRSTDRFPLGEFDKEVLTDLDNIIEQHANDGEVLYYVSNAMRRLGHSEQAEMRLMKSIELGYRSGAALLRSAEIKLRDGDKKGALADLFEAFQNSAPGRFELIRGIEILRQVAPDRIDEAATSPAFSSLSPLQCLLVVRELDRSKEGLQVSVDLLERSLEKAGLTDEERGDLKRPLMLSLIGLSRFDEAIGLWGYGRPNPLDLGIHDCFNYAMADWGRTGSLSEDMFEQVVRLDSSTSREAPGANYCQCLAVALWAIGRKEDALNRLAKALDRIAREPRHEFSCWRYIRVIPDLFRQDCESIRGLIQGKKVRPVFFKR